MASVVSRTYKNGWGVNIEQDGTSEPTYNIFKLADPAYDKLLAGGYDITVIWGTDPTQPPVVTVIAPPTNSSSVKE